MIDRHLDGEPGNPAFQLNQIARMMVRYFDRLLAPLRINVANLAVLGALRETEGLSQKELTEIGRIGQPAMAQMLDRMLKEGLLVREQDASDRRRAIFTLSAAALHVFPQLEAVLEKGNAEAFSVLTASELEELLRILKKLEQHLGTLRD